MSDDPPPILDYQPPASRPRLPWWMVVSGCLVLVTCALGCLVGLMTFRTGQPQVIALGLIGFLLFGGLGLLEIGIFTRHDKTNCSPIIAIALAVSLIASLVVIGVLIDLNNGTGRREPIRLLGGVLFAGLLAATALFIAITHVCWACSKDMIDRRPPAE